MSDATTPSPQDAIADRREQVLGLLAEKALALACEVQERALAAEGTDDFVRLSGAFAKVARCVRQTVALHAKLTNDRGKAEREAVKRAEDEKARATLVKKARVHVAVERCLWDEYEPEEEIDEAEAGILQNELSTLLDRAAEEPGFLETPVDTLIARLCERFGITPPDPAAPPPFRRIRTRYADSS
jgi:hypothetical protein